MHFLLDFLTSTIPISYSGKLWTTDRNKDFPGMRLAEFRDFRKRKLKGKTRTEDMQSRVRTSHRNSTIELKIELGTFWSVDYGVAPEVTGRP